MKENIGEKEDNFYVGLSFFFGCLAIIALGGITIEIYQEIGWIVFLIIGGVISIFLLAIPTGKLLKKISGSI